MPYHCGSIHPSSTQMPRTGTYLSQVLRWNQRKEKFCYKLLSRVRSKRKRECESKQERERSSAHFGFKFCLFALSTQLGFYHPAWQLCSFSAVWHEPASFLLWCCAICMFPCLRALRKKEKSVKEAICFWNPLLLQLGSVLSWDAQHCSSFHNRMIWGPLKSADSNRPQRAVAWDLILHRHFIFSHSVCIQMIAGSCWES